MSESCSGGVWWDKKIEVDEFGEDDIRTIVIGWVEDGFQRVAFKAQLTKQLDQGVSKLLCWGVFDVVDKKDMVCGCIYGGINADIPVELQRLV